jgi:hypothetical protein
MHHMHLEQALKIKLHAAFRENMGGLGVFLLQGAALSRALCVTHARPFAFLARMSYGAALCLF